MAPDKRVKQKKEDNRIRALREIAFHAAMSVKDDFVDEQAAGRKNALRIDTELNHVHDHLASVGWLSKVDYGRKTWERLENTDRECLRLAFEIFSWTHDRGKWFLSQIMPRILKSKAGKKTGEYSLAYNQVLKKLDLSPGEQEILDRAVKVYEDGLEIGAYSFPPDIGHHLLSTFDLVARSDFLQRLPRFEQALILTAVVGAQFEGYYRPWAKKLGYSPKAQKAIWLIRNKSQAEKVFRRMHPEATPKEVDLAWGLFRVANDSDKTQMVHVGSLIHGPEGKWVRLGGAFKILTYAMSAWFASLRKKSDIRGLKEVFVSALGSAEQVVGVKVVSIKEGAWKQTGRGEILTAVGREFAQDHFGLFLEFANEALHGKRFKRYREMIQMYADHCQGAKDCLEAARANAEVAAAVLKQALDVFLRERSEDLVGL